MKNYFKLLTIFLLLLSYSLFSQQENLDIFSIARSGSLTDLKTILEKKPESIDQKNMSGYTPLILACYSGNNEVAKYIIDKSNNIDLSNGYGTALMASVVKGNEELVTYLLSNKADVNISDDNGTTALHYAVIFNLEKIAEKLINSGAKYNLKDNRGNTAKDYATLKNNQKILTLFKN